MKPKTFSEFDDEMLELNTFVLRFPGPEPITYVLPGTLYKFHLIYDLREKELKIRWFHKTDPISFENMLDNAPNEVQEKLVFCLDFFRKFTQLE